MPGGTSESTYMNDALGSAAGLMGAVDSMHVLCPPAAVGAMGWTGVCEWDCATARVRSSSVRVGKTADRAWGSAPAGDSPVVRRGYDRAVSPVREASPIERGSSRHAA
jgi:hypothetical protein